MVHLVVMVWVANTGGKSDLEHGSWVKSTSATMLFTRLLCISPKLEITLSTSERFNSSLYDDFELASGVRLF